MRPRRTPPRSTLLHLHLHLHLQQRHPPAAAAPDDMVAKLQQLAALKDSGVLSQEEFVAAKQKLLS